MRLIFNLIFFIVFLFSFVWIMKNPGFDSIGFAATLFITWITFYFSGKDDKSTGQIQQVSGKSIAIQAGRDVKLNISKNE